MSVIYSSVGAPNPENSDRGGRPSTLQRNLEAKLIANLSTAFTKTVDQFKKGDFYDELVLEGHASNLHNSIKELAALNPTDCKSAARYCVDNMGRCKMPSFWPNMIEKYFGYKTAEEYPLVNFDAKLNFRILCKPPLYHPLEIAYAPLRMRVVDVRSLRVSSDEMPKFHPGFYVCAVVRVEVPFFQDATLSFRLSTDGFQLNLRVVTVAGKSCDLFDVEGQVVDGIIIPSSPNHFMKWNALGFRVFKNDPIRALYESANKFADWRSLPESRAFQALLDSQTEFSWWPADMFFYDQPTGDLNPAIVTFIEAFTRRIMEDSDWAWLHNTRILSTLPHLYVATADFQKPKVIPTYVTMPMEDAERISFPTFLCPFMMDPDVLQ